MSKLLYSATMSLDGFIAGPGGDMSWLTEFVGQESDFDFDDFMDGVGALLIGRRTFGGDDPNAGTDSAGAFGGRWRGTSVVLTHHPGTDSRDTVFADSLEAAVALATEAAGGRYVNVLGADVARQCLDAGLLDEVLVFVVPVLLGSGTRLFDRPAGGKVRLEPLDPSSSQLWYRVVR